jgi:hypothetical protein
MTLHLAVHVQPVGGAIDASFLDVDPRAVDELVEPGHCRGLFRRVNRQAAEDNRRAPGARIDDDCPAVGDADDAGHRRGGAGGAGKQNTYDK